MITLSTIINVTYNSHLLKIDGIKLLSPQKINK